jgi:plastocyanin
METSRRRLLAAGSELVAVAAAGCTGLTQGGDGDSTDDGDGSNGTTNSDPWDVGMAASDFRPAELEVSVGDTVVWKNTGSRAHTVTAYEDAIPADADYFASGGFDSQDAAEDGWRSGFEGAIRSGETYEHAFEVPGEYDYFCVPHEPAGMVGTIVVTE